MAESSSKQDYFVGVDLGGTKILAGIFDNSLKNLATAKLSTKSQRGVEAVIERVARCVQDAVDEADLSLKQIVGVGIGAPGSVDFDSGTVIFAPNLEGWKDVPLKKHLEKLLGVPVFVENDCNIAALGVYAAELKSKPRHMVGIFVGTGIGGGIVIDGHLYSGFGHTAGEIGHMVLEVNGPKCGCGNKGCFEALASRTAIFQRIKAGVKDGQKTLLTDMLGDDLDDLRSGDLRKAIRRGDKFVDKVIEEAAEYIGIATANLINILNPEVVVLGGGVMEALQDEMMSVIIETAKDYAMAGAMKGVEIVASKLGDDAGITGGAVLARREAKKA
ncbi:MAG TPA: ROK family protein [Verrucomicrobiota bacterium]|nr:ROK family protein [Verrucomicrobiota bacterium]HRT58232.1 ROK family protein [Candidatus Paceibacterota bacterium]